MKILFFIALFSAIALGFNHVKPEPDFGATEQNILQRITDSQTAYFKINGKYWQGLENWNAKPFYQSKSMAELINVSDLNPTSPKIRVDQYESLKGKGYQVIMTYPDGSIKSYGYGVEAGGRTYQRPAPITIKSATST